MKTIFYDYNLLPGKCEGDKIEKLLDFIEADIKVNNVENPFLVINALTYALLCSYGHCKDHFEKDFYNIFKKYGEIKNISFGCNMLELDNIIKVYSNKTLQFIIIIKNMLF